MEKRKTWELFPALPQPRLLLAGLVLKDDRSCDRSGVLANFAGLCVEPDQQLVCHGDAYNLGRFAGCSQPLLEDDEVGFVTSDHTSYDEEDVAHRRAASAHGSLSLVLA